MKRQPPALPSFLRPPCARGFGTGLKRGSYLRLKRRPGLFARGSAAILHLIDSRAGVACASSDTYIRRGMPRIGARGQIGLRDPETGSGNRR